MSVLIAKGATRTSLSGAGPGLDTSIDIVVVEGESEVCCDEAARGMLMRCGELMALSVALRAREGSRRGGRGAEGGTVC